MAQCRSMQSTHSRHGSTGRTAASTLVRSMTFLAQVWSISRGYHVDHAANILTLQKQEKGSEPQRASKQGAWSSRCLMTVFCCPTPPGEHLHAILHRQAALSSSADRQAVAGAAYAVRAPPCAPLLLQHRSLFFLQLHLFCSGTDLPAASITTALLRCSLSAELEAARLCNGGPGGKQAEVAGLVLAIMAERCLGIASRSAQGPHRSRCSRGVVAVVAERCLGTSSSSAHALLLGATASGKRCRPASAAQLLL